jgi:hypothetical protein
LKSARIACSTLLVVVGSVVVEPVVELSFGVTVIVATPSLTVAVTSAPLAPITNTVATAPLFA